MGSKRRIRKVAVLGSGVMGSQIAAHCVNAGLEVVLLDLKSDDPKRPNKIAEESVQKILKMKPAPFGLPEFAARIKPGNFEDSFHLGDLQYKRGSSNIINILLLRLLSINSSSDIYFSFRRLLLEVFGITSCKMQR